jgi:protein-S-isoprenylcysteine O-methyltransferase Ste14
MNKQNKMADMHYRIATGSTKIRTILTPFAAMLFFTIIVLLILFSHWLDMWLRLPVIFLKPYNFIFSIPPLTAGLALIIWCNYYFVKAKGTPVPLNPPPRLVNTGPYAFTRNPMLTGVFLVMFGTGIMIHSIFLIFFFTPIFIMLNYVEIRYVEEPELEKRLGTMYVEYKKKVPMFFPRIKIR